MQKCLGKKLHCIYLISLVTLFSRDICPSLLTQVMVDVNFIPLSLSFAVRWSYQQAALLPAGRDRREQIKAAFEGSNSFQPEDTKQIPTVHLNRGLACCCKYFIEYILQTPQQFTASHLLLTCATRLPSSLVGLFWWLPELSQSKYFAVLCSNAMGITKYWEPVVVMLVEQCNLPRTFVTSSGYRHSVLRLAWRYLSWSTPIN